MIVVLHGENRLASRRTLIEKINFFRIKGSEIVRFDGRTADLTDFKQACETVSLFSSQRLIVVEGFFKRPPGQEKARIEDYLHSLSSELNLIFWEEASLTPTQIKKLPSQSKAYLFKVQPIIFKFLDSLLPGNSKTSLGLLAQCYQQDSAEMVFYMLCRQIRLLILANNLRNKGLIGMPYWMQNKFLNQARSFSLGKLLVIHRQLLKIDYEQKTGRAVMPLPFHLDLLVANL